VQAPSGEKAFLSMKKITSMVAIPNSTKAKQRLTPLCQQPKGVWKRLEGGGEHKLFHFFKLEESIHGVLP
jgi:hypothetical protein